MLVESDFRENDEGNSGIKKKLVVDKRIKPVDGKYKKKRRVVEGASG